MIFIKEHCSESEFIEASNGYVETALKKFTEMPVQLATKNETPRMKLEDVKKILSKIDTLEKERNEKQ